MDNIFFNSKLNLRRNSGRPNERTHVSVWCQIAYTIRQKTYFVKNLAPNFGELLATNPSALHSKPYGSGSGQYIGTPPNNPGASGSYLTGSIDGVNQGIPVDAEHVVHMKHTLNVNHTYLITLYMIAP